MLAGFQKLLRENFRCGRMLPSRAVPVAGRFAAPICGLTRARRGPGGHIQSGSPPTPGFFMPRDFSQNQNKIKKVGTPYVQVSF